MPKYVLPSYESRSFNCRHCVVLAIQDWSAMAFGAPGTDGKGFDIRFVAMGKRVSRCNGCNPFAFWIGSTLVYPDSGVAPIHHDEMPPDVAADFDEARNIINKSPRGAAALFRLAIQKLMPHAGQSGKDINTDIGNLVANGLDVHVQQACDAVRIVGNDSAHPGTLNVNATPEIAHLMLDLLNFIVDEMIAKKKRINAYYLELPAHKLQGVKDRDK